MPPEFSWASMYEQWHDFFLMAGTAAVTLAGLLFVAISIHIDTLVQARREHLLDLARATLLTFVMVLVLSLSMLVPKVSQRLAGFEMMVLGGVFALMTARMLIFTRGEHHADFSLKRFRRRLGLPLLGYLWVALTGYMLLSSPSPFQMHFLVGAVCTLLGNASGTSWELLVRLAKIRRGDVEGESRPIPKA